MNTRTVWGMVGVAVSSCLVMETAQAQYQNAESQPLSRASQNTTAETAFHPGQWKGGAGLGLLGSTPDGTAFATNGNLDYFVAEHVSIGPLLQVAMTGDMVQTGLSAQGKYWIDLPGSGGRGKVILQSGFGLVHADVFRDDTSWLVPLGAGVEYALSSGANLTATALVNVTDLNTGGGTGADVMPGFVVGVSF